MTLRDPDKYRDSAWDWAIFDGIFPKRAIKFADIDGHVEICGRFLYLEAKGSGVAIPWGQRIAMEERVQDGRSTFIVVWGSVNRPEAYQLIGVMDEPEPCDLRGLRRRIRDWVRYAQTSARPPRYAPDWLPPFREAA